MQRLIPIFFVVLTFYSVSGQNKTGTETSAPDTISKKQSVSGHSLYLASGGGNNMVYLGSTISGENPYYYASLVYGFRDKLFLSGSAVHIDGIEPFAAFYSGSISFSHTFNSWFDLSASVSGYTVPGILKDSLFGDFIYSDLTLGFDWKILYTKISAGWLSSGDNGYYLQARNSRYFETKPLFRGKATLTFDPFVNILAGSITKARTLTGTKIIVLPPIKKVKTKTVTTTTTEYYTEFGAMEINGGLPVSLDFPMVSFEIEAGYIHSLFDDSVYPGARGFYFLGSVLVKIF